MKQKTLDHINGFSLALLAAMPIIRADVLSGGPVYLLILPSFMLAASGILKMYSEGNKKFNAYTISYFYAIVLLFVYLILSSFWNVNGVPVNQEIIKILFLLFIAFSVLITFNKQSTYYFLMWMIAFATMVTIMLFKNYITTRSLRGYLDISYLTTSQLIGMGAIASYSMLLFSPKYKGKGAMFLSFFLFIGLAASLARGALVSGIGLASLMTIYYFKENKSKSYSLSQWFKNKSFRILSFFFIGSIVLAAFQVERTARRLLLLLGGTLGGRETLWTNSILGFLEEPLIGYGLGNSGIISSAQINYYPHNLFLQVLIDGGIVAAAILFIICLYPIIRSYTFLKNNHYTSNLIIPILAMYSFLFFEYFKSSSFYEARVFIAIALVLVIITEKSLTIK